MEEKKLWYRKIPLREAGLGRGILSHVGRGATRGRQGPGSKQGSSGKWSDATWTHGKQLEQLLQQVTTLSVSHEQNRARSSYAMARKGVMK